MPGQRIENSSDVCNVASRLQRAETCAREAVEIVKKMTKGDKHLLGRAYTSLTRALLAARKPTEAEVAYKLAGQELGWPCQGEHREELEELRGSLAEGDLPQPTIEMTRQQVREVCDEMPMLAIRRKNVSLG